MSLFLPPTPSSVPAPKNDDLAYFVEKYGFHGTVMCLSGKERGNDVDYSCYGLSEVRQLNFSYTIHRGEKSDYTEDDLQMKDHIIPPLPEQDYALTSEENYATYLASEGGRFWNAIRHDGSVFRAYLDGANYNLPVGLKRWVDKEEPEYEALSKLPVLDYVH